jgi:hypothetical protein
MASSAKLREEREWSEGANGQQGSPPEGVRGFNGWAWSRCRLHLDGGDWARVAVSLVRHRELSLALGSARSGVRCVLHSSAGFRSGACVLVCGTTCWAG